MSEKSEDDFIREELERRIKIWEYANKNFLEWWDKNYTYKERNYQSFPKGKKPTLEDIENDRRI